MRKVIVVLALVAGLPGMAQAEWVTIFGDHRSIFTMQDNGDVTTSIANRTAGGWIIVDDRGNMIIVNDYSSARDGRYGYPASSRPAWRDPSHDRRHRHDAYNPFVSCEQYTCWSGFTNRMTTMPQNSGSPDYSQNDLEADSIRPGVRKAILCIGQHIRHGSPNALIFLD